MKSEILEFPIEKLDFTSGQMESHVWSIDPTIIYYKFKINTKKFKIENQQEEFGNAMGGDFLELDHKNFKELENRNFNFPDNPEEGYIDSAIYYQACHHPVYIKSICFQNLRKKAIDAEFKFQIQFEYEGSTFRNTEFVKRKTRLEFGNLILDRDDLINKYSIKEISNKLSDKINLNHYEKPFLEEYDLWISDTESIRSKKVIYKFKTTTNTI